MTDFVRVCSLTELDDDKPFAVEVGDTPVVLVRQGATVHALHDECSHAAVPLSDGDVYDGTIECYLHGSTFDLSSGRPTCLPATEPVPVYTTRIDGDDVLVALQENNA